ncbi:hypothetical protein EMGBS15_05800, partial [Filimonas sp.]
YSLQVARMLHINSSISSYHYRFPWCTRCLGRGDQYHHFAEHHQWYLRKTRTLRDGRKVGLYWHFVDLVWVFVFTCFICCKKDVREKERKSQGKPFTNKRKSQIKQHTHKKNLDIMSEFSHYEAGPICALFRRSSSGGKQ